MKKITPLKGMISLLLLFTFAVNETDAQNASANPTTVSAASLPQSVTLTGTSSGNRRYKAPTTWSVISTPVNTISVGSTTISANANNNTAIATATIPAGTTPGIYTFRLSYTYSTSSNGNGSNTGTLDVTVTVIGVALNSLPTQSVLAGGTVSFTATSVGFAGSGNNYSYTWTVPGASVSGSNPATNTSSSNTKTLTFPAAGTYTVTVTATRSSTTATSYPVTVNVYAIPPANLWATSSNGTRVSSFAVINGLYAAGPTNIFTPTFPGGTTGGSSTAALGKNTSGFYYWLPNTSGNNGRVDVYGATSNGTGTTLIGTLDLNGASNTSLGFVRLGMGPDGRGWILAGDGSSNLMLATFMTNGLNPAVITIEDASVNILSGSVSTFQNGDICVLGNGDLYALANNGSGVTQIFIGKPNGSSTTLTKKWDLVNPSNAPFTGTVNGVAFDPFGSLYISTGDGLYYIDQHTVNSSTPIPTVQCVLVRSQTGLQDLASNYFPEFSVLPVTLVSFSGTYNNNMTTLNWKSAHEINFSHFEIERSSDGVNYSNIGSKTPIAGNGSTSVYQFADNLSTVNGTVFYYRLKMIDIDQKFKYSNIILVRKDIKNMTNISMSPNPVVNKTATLRVSAATAGKIDIRIIDLTGKVVSQQQNTVNPGVNSIWVTNLDRVQKGMYILQIINNNELSSLKFSVVH